MGELQPGQNSNQDELFMSFISSANISCGAHSGTQSVIENTVSLAIQHKLKIGAHPSYPDRENFGRVSMHIDSESLMSSIKTQLQFLHQIVEDNKGKISYVKAHGALYNDLASNKELAMLFIDCVKNFNPAMQIMGLAGSPLKNWVKEQGLKFISEVFADRRYTADLKLKSRKESGALIANEQELNKQLSRFLDDLVTDDLGQQHKINWDSICFHSDTPGALDLIRSANKLLKEKNISLAQH